MALLPSICGVVSLIGLLGLYLNKPKGEEGNVCLFISNQNCN